MIRDDSLEAGTKGHVGSQPPIHLLLCVVEDVLLDTKSAGMRSLIRAPSAQEGMREVLHEIVSQLSCNGIRCEVVYIVYHPSTTALTGNVQKWIASNELPSGEVVKAGMGETWFGGDRPREKMLAYLKRKLQGCQRCVFLSSHETAEPVGQPRYTENASFVGDIVHGALSRHRGIYDTGTSVAVGTKYAKPIFDALGFQRANSAAIVENCVYFPFDSVLTLRKFLFCPRLVVRAPTEREFAVLRMSQHSTAFLDDTGDVFLHLHPMEELLMVLTTGKGRALDAPFTATLASMLTLMGQKWRQFREDPFVALSLRIRYIGQPGHMYCVASRPFDTTAPLFWYSKAEEEAIPFALCGCVAAHAHQAELHRCRLAVAAGNVAMLQTAPSAQWSQASPVKLPAAALLSQTLREAFLESADVLYWICSASRKLSSSKDWPLCDLGPEWTFCLHSEIAAVGQSSRKVAKLAVRLEVLAMHMDSAVFVSMFSSLPDLHYALIAHSVDILRVLVDCGFQFPQRFSRTVRLHTLWDARLVPLLVRAGVNPDRRDAQGRSALTAALENQRRDVAIALLECCRQTKSADELEKMMAIPAFRELGLFDEETIAQMRNAPDQNDDDDVLSGVADLFP